MFPIAWKRGRRMVDRVASIADIAEPLLGGRAWIREQPHGRLFISPDFADTILFPMDHPRSGQPRYRWVARPDGSEWGYLEETLNPKAESRNRTGSNQGGVV